MPNSRQNKRTRAHYIHRLSYSAQEKLAGSFVLIAVVLLVWLLLSSQKTQNLFEEEITLYATMSSIQAVNKDTDVIISGLNIGSVTDVDIDDDNHVVITMSILKKYQKLIRTDSTAELLDFKFALLGKSVIEISVGSPQLPVIEDGSTLAIKESFNLVQLVAKFEPVLVTLQDSIRKINDILQAIDPQKIGDNLSNLDSISSDLKIITQQIRQGKGVAGNAIFNQDMQDDVVATTANLKQLTEQTRGILEQTRLLLISLQQQIDEMPELTDKVKPLLDEADKTIKATQKIWPLSSSIPKENKQTLTSPEATE
ncbi:MAG: MCE family protein [Gammaproteobacteria bacterium]|nr:MCE family protein [Gammaproteobacteria bacterium]MBT8135008.1 MCE family protein [Gammaproteobacteria bacterium]NNJ50972.1 MCE family protein [Gammaproteobacteria bacterium]